MSSLFVHIFDWFERHTRLLYVTLVAVVAVCAIMASQLRFQENITNFFGGDDSKSGAVFDKVAAADRIVVLFEGDNPDDILTSAELFEQDVASMCDRGLVKSVKSTIDENVVAGVVEFVYRHLPIFLQEEDYQRLEQTLTQEGIDAAVGSVYRNLTSAQGIVVRDVVMRDPLNIGTPLLREFEQFSPDAEYEIYDDRLFTADLRRMVIFIEPSYQMGDTGRNDALVTALEQAEREAEINGVSVDCIGGPVIAVHNARQIKQDTTLTLSIAMAIIIVVIMLSFRNRWSIPFIIVPPLFGALFALAMVWLHQGEISAIAIGTGAIVLGISLSYSIHIVSHLNHISSPREIIRELASPLTIGCFTTIGAFAALRFTGSPLLQDMGLFALYALIGTTLFSLIFLPHFLKRFDAKHKPALFNGIERLVGYNYERSHRFVLPIVVLALVALFFYRDVKFDGDMSNINYMPEHIVKAEERAMSLLGDNEDKRYIVTSAADVDALVERYSALMAQLDAAKQSGAVGDIVSIERFLVSGDEQLGRIERWNSFWAERREQTMALVNKAAANCGFKEGAFVGLEKMLTAEYQPCGYSQADIAAVSLLSEWMVVSEDAVSALGSISVEEQYRADLYADLDTLEGVTVIDRGHFSSKMVEAIVNDFNYILLISSLIVFVALLFSYGRLELALLTFLPMCISWVIILGMMAVFDIRFNIVNIILATLIFGLGDDFSIFVMDGLLQEYRSGKRVLASHKTAIFFSAFTAIVGMGVLIFAQHPALKSIALISVLGLSVVVLVAYTIQPWLFRLFVSSQTRKGGWPYTLWGAIYSLTCFLLFLLGCLMLQLLMLVLMLLPLKRRHKKAVFHRVIFCVTRFLHWSMLSVRTIRLNPHGERFDKPAVIIANHQSFIDILLLLSTTPKIVMVTNSWVWNSPFFGRIVRYADFYHAADGYEALADTLRERVAEGYSVVVFPEGTRSADCSVLRFHKGAFYLAELLKLDVLPMVIYGTGHVSAKRQGFYIKQGVIALNIMQRVPYGNTSFGTTYQEQAKCYRQWFAKEYNLMNERFGRSSNAYFRGIVKKNYLYRGAQVEWHIAWRCHLERYFDWWDRLLPREGQICVVGCGYGELPLMLGALSVRREIRCYEGDAMKVKLAQHSLLAEYKNIHLECKEERSVEFQSADVILFESFVQSDYADRLLLRALAALNAGGMVIVRMRGNSQGVAGVEWLTRFADENKRSISIEQCEYQGSDVVYIVRNKSNE